MSTTPTVVMPVEGAASIEGKGFAVIAYLSPNDGQPVIEIDTTPGLGEVRVYINDGQVYAADPEDI
jgi:hypothetical protein